MYVVVLTTRSFIGAINTVQVEVADLAKLYTLAVTNAGKLRC